MNNRERLKPKKSDSVKMSGTLCGQKQRNRGRKGEIHGLIGPWPSRTVLYNVLMVSGSEGSHGKVLPSHAKSAENLSKLSGQRNVTQRTRATWLDLIISVPLITYWRAEWGFESTDIFHKWTLTAGLQCFQKLPREIPIMYMKGEWSQAHLAG